MLVHRALGSRRSFFSSEANLLDPTGNRAVTDLAVPQLSQFGLGLIGIGFHELSKLRPVSNFVAVAWMGILLGLYVGCISIWR